MTWNIQNDMSAPVITQIQQQITSMIRQRQLKAGDRIPSIRKISDQVKVSTSVVKQAISILVAQGYLVAQPGSGVYVAEPHSMRQCIVMVVPTIVESISCLMKGVKQGLADSSARLQIQSADMDFSKEADIIKKLDSSQVAGAIIYPPPINAYILPLRELKKKSVPYVLVDSEFESLGVDSVTVDQIEMGRMAMEYLWSKGHRKIGIVDISVDVGLQKTRMGANEILLANGMKFEDLPRIITDAEDLNAEEPWANGQKATMELLKSNPDLTAIIGMNDYLSLGVLRGVKATGRSVPKDVSVLGMGDISASRLSEPPLTVIAQPTEQIGKKAAERLLQIIDGTMRDYAAIHIKPDLIERESVKNIS